MSLTGYLKSHPVALLLALTPGIPEYLSSSSPINAIVLNPFMFLFQILANLGLYGSGVLLIYEAKVRWRKGWATVLLLGAAYGILEEGVALSTLYDPKANPVGDFGIYGHWVGVNWIWSAGIVPFHALWSISLPILLLGLALPETVGKSLLSKRRIGIVAVIFLIDVLVLMAFVSRASGYWMGLPILVLSLVFVGVLIFAARRVPAGALAAKPVIQGAPNKVLAIAGISFFPVVLLTENIPKAAGVPATLDFILVLLVQALFLVYVVRSAGIGENRKGLLSLSLGLIIPIAVFGVVAEIALPMTLLADLAMVLFFRRLWMRGNPTSESGNLEPPKAIPQPTQ
ncbi:MAG: hypothetical protein OK436_05030 [Thaumarchaeota archaeon]|nr:hypothetical protein [Nitrososphaerota archaeon]